jgi:hypothetical protein
MLTKLIMIYEIEDLLKEVDHIHLLPIRKKNSKRAYPQCVSFVQHYYRKRIETAGSLIERARSQGSNPWQTQVMAFGILLTIPISKVGACSCGFLVHPL